MTLKEWDELYRNDREKWLELYKEFMCNSKNAGDCDHCPANNDMGGNGQCPCGQYRCWVDAHCSND